MTRGGSATAWVVTTAALALLAPLGAGGDLRAQSVHYELDRDWPQLPLPDRWLTGGLGGMCVDPRDHVYVVNRQNVVDEDLNAATLAPPVIEFDPEGRVVRGWGDMERLGPRLHDCHVDAEGHVWVVAAGTGYVQKYAPDGSELVLQIGETGRFDSSDGTREGTPLNSDTAQFFLPAAIDVAPDTGEIFVADGELRGGNARIAVLDAEGRFLRQWSLHRAPGESVTPLPHCLRLSRDGLVYVCDRQADRIQVYDRMGAFVRNLDVAWPDTAPPGERRGTTRGTAVVLGFSPDADQRHLFVINQNSVQVEILDRQTGAIVGRFGDGPGRYPGQFTLPHGIGVDSEGRVYVAEQEGRRLQRFVPVDR